PVAFGLLAFSEALLRSVRSSLLLTSFSQSATCCLCFGTHRWQWRSSSMWISQRGGLTGCASSTSFRRCSSGLWFISTFLTVRGDRILLWKWRIGYGKGDLSTTEYWRAHSWCVVG